MDNTTVIKLLEQHKTDIKELMSGQSVVISARVDAKFDQKFAPLDSKVDALLEHNKRQNGWIATHTKKLEALDKESIKFEKANMYIKDYQKNCHANKLAKKLSTRRFWIIATALTIISYITLATIWHTIGFGDLILKLVESI